MLLLSVDARKLRLVLVLLASLLCMVHTLKAQEKKTDKISYLKLTKPRRVLAEAQAWEGKEFPHTLSVVEWNHDGFRYWGWYGLNEGRGMGVARSNDLVNWVKYAENPVLSNARWPSVLANADPKHPELLYLAFTREYDTPSSCIVLGTTSDGIHIAQVKTLVPQVPNQRNQNPNLFRDPQSGRFFLTYYRGNDHDQFEIVSRSAADVNDLDKAPEKVLMRTTDTVAAPNLLYLEHGKAVKAKRSGTYYLATEIFPHRYTTNPEGEWQVKVFAAAAPDGDFKPVERNPIMRGQRACLFQHIFNGRFYGYDCHLEDPDHWVLEVVEAPIP